MTERPKYVPPLSYDNDPRFGLIGYADDPRADQIARKNAAPQRVRNHRRDFEAEQLRRRSG